MNTTNDESIILEKRKFREDENQEEVKKSIDLQKRFKRDMEDDLAKRNDFLDQ